LIPTSEKLIFTIGHSTHPIKEFLALLAQHQIAALADVRSYPSSRRWPQFNQPDLKASVEGAGAQYRWLQLLGGRRHGIDPGSPHTAWRVAAFRSYADYAEGDDFERGLTRLSALAADTRTAYMCSEGLWWECHRRIISDHLLMRGWTVRHIMPDGKFIDHALPDFARVVDDRLIYDGAGKELK